MKREFWDWLAFIGQTLFWMTAASAYIALLIWGGTEGWKLL